MISSAETMKKPENVFSLYMGCSSFTASLFEMQSLWRETKEGQDMSESQWLGGAAYRANTLWK